MTTVKAHELLEEIKNRHRADHPGGCRILSQGDACQCTLCLCDEVHEAMEAERSKWWAYEQEYILPCFKWAAEMGYDLEAAVRDKPGKNCVELLVEWLRSRLSGGPQDAK